MAKPINLYQGPAPAAMSQMGAGLAEAGANIGRSLQQGYQSMGQGLAGGINAAVGEYAKYKDMNAQVKASEKSYETLKSYLPEDVRKQFDLQIESLNKSDTTSLRDKAAFWDQAKSFIGASVGQTFAMQKQKAELDAAAARQQQQIAANQIQPYYEKTASLLTQPYGAMSKPAGYGGGKAPGSVSIEEEKPFTFGGHY